MVPNLLRVCTLTLVLIFFAELTGAQNYSRQALDEQFSDYNIMKINATELLNVLNAQRNNEEHELQLWSWNLKLKESGIITPSYKAIAYDGTRESFLPPYTGKALNGYTDQGGRVSLTINHDFIQGYVNTGMYTFYFEPLYHFDRKAARDLVVLYNTKDIKPGKERTCGATASHKVRTQQEKMRNSGERMPGGCFTVDYAIASDYSMFSFYGSTTGVQNHNIAVTNDVQTNYDTEFADALQFQIVQQFIVTTANGDPATWTSTTSPGTLLSNFTAWGPSGFNTPHDVGSLWTRRDFDGTTVGIAWVGAVCTSSRYNALQDFTSNASQKRVLTAHEIGHNFDADHDSSSGFIMSPSVNNTSTWSSTSITAIQNHYLSRTCLSTCLIGPPQISFSTSSSTVIENGGSGSTGSCNEPFKTINVPVTLDRSSASSITASVTLASGSTAQSNRDFVLLTNSLTFPAGSATTLNVQVRITDDAIAESDESFTLQLSITGGTAILGSNPTHQVTIIDSDVVSSTCCSQTEFQFGSGTNQAPIIFYGYYEDARTRALFLPSQLTAAGLTAGNISSIQFFVNTKGSTLPYNNFKVGMANVTNTTLLNMSWISTTEVFSGNITTTQGVWSEIVFTTPFFWNGTSSLYIEFCFDNGTDQWTNNDQIYITNAPGGAQGRFIEVLYQDGLSGCTLSTSNSNLVGYNNAQPQFRFKQITAPKIENAITTSIKSSLKSGEQANFYSAAGKVFASVKNIGTTDINCIEANVETAGTSKLSLPFGGGDYSAKTIKIDAAYSAVYEVTLYYTQTELNTFGANANKLNIIKTQSTLASSTLTNSTISRPDSIISGFGPDNAFGYKGTFSGFSRFALTNRNITPGSTITNGDLVINESGKGFILKNKSGENFLTTVTNAGTLNTQSVTQSTGTNLNKSDLSINTTSTNIILRSPNGTYRRLSVSDTGVLSVSTISLPAQSARLSTGNLILEEHGGAILMKSPNGNCWRMYVNENGQIRSTPTLCP